MSQSRIRIFRPSPAEPAASPRADDVAPRRKFGSGPWRLDVHGERRRPRALLVDDDDDCRELFAWCLRAAGWSVETAGDGEQGLLKAVGWDPDIVVLDLGMPTLDGWGMLACMRSSPTVAHVPVVVCTTRDEADLVERTRDRGCARLVRKPCAPDDLRAVVEAVLFRA